MKRIKPSQAEWYCGRLDKKFTATPEAYSPDHNWLCPCGYFIKDSPHLHRMIRKGERIKEEPIEEIVYNEQDLQEYIVYYWVSHKEKTKMFKAYNTNNLKEEIGKTFIGLLPFAAFKILIDRPQNLQVLVNTI